MFTANPWPSIGLTLTMFACLPFLFFVLSVGISAYLCDPLCNRSHFGQGLRRDAATTVVSDLPLIASMQRLIIAAFAILQVQSSSVDSNGTANETTRSGLKLKRLVTTGGPVTILHVSDTHSLHWSVGDLPSADIFIHSGDVSTIGSDGEVGDFNNWLGSLKGKYREMFVISGNHDFWETNWRLNRGALSESTARSPTYFQQKITNAKAPSNCGTRPQG